MGADRIETDAYVIANMEEPFFYGIIGHRNDGSIATVYGYFILHRRAKVSGMGNLAVEEC